MDLEAGEEGFVITNVAIFPKKEGEMDGAEGDWIRRGKYLGPRMYCTTSSDLSIIIVITCEYRKDLIGNAYGTEFDHLDESVQDAFAGFLAERGVDESLCKLIHTRHGKHSWSANFVLSYAEHKEQKVRSFFQ